MFQTLVVQSRDEEATNRPSGENATATTDLECPLIVPQAAPVFVSESRTVRSSAAEARQRPSGENATALTEAVWPSKTPHAWPVLAFQSLTVRSLDPEARSSPSDEKTTALTASAWPSKHASCELQLSRTAGRPLSHPGSCSLNACRMMLRCGAKRSAERYACSGASSIICRFVRTRRCASSANAPMSRSTLFLPEKKR